jgi:hypothetical protein
MQVQNINKSPSPGNSKCGHRAALLADPFQKLRAGLNALADRYAGCPVHGDIIRIAAQVERIGSRAGAR